MGSCASAHRNSSVSAMKLRLSFGSKTDKLVIPASPVKDNTNPVNEDLPIKSQWSSPSRSASSFRNFGSNEETFFDSQPWIESDCEDDFFSVNGDFTPSRGNTPVHHSFSTGTPQVNKPLLVDRPPGSTPEPSPTEKKKRLVELFQESSREGKDVDDQYTSGNSKSAYGTPYVSGTNSLCSSERTANGDFIMDKEKPIRSVQCCLPSLVSCRSFSERKKKMSPAIAVNDKP